MRRVSDANEINTKNMKCTCPTQRPNARDPTPPIFHWELGLRLLPYAKKSTHKKRNVHGRRKKLASPNARDTNMLVFLASANAKVLLFALPDAKVPDARYFAFWWNIGLRETVQSHEQDQYDLLRNLGTN